jgi:RNA polymerase sigma-70 factor (ECF subfamily)
LEQFMSNGVVRPAPPPAIGESFDDVVLPHLAAAYRLARWRMRNEDDAEDVVQEALLRAFRYFRTYTGGNGRAWFLRIVRNTCSGWHGRRAMLTDTFDEEQHSGETATSPETLLLQSDTAVTIARAMGHLPDRLRELLVLREVEGLSYREMADLKGIPMGTVMSSLWRARQALRSAFDDRLGPSGIRRRHIPGDGRPARRRREPRRPESTHGSDGRSCGDCRRTAVKV